MKLLLSSTTSLILLTILLSSTTIQSFTPSSIITTTTKTTTRTTITTTTKLYGLSAQDILKRARQAAGVPEEEEEPPLFNDTIMNDFQESLLSLEKRVKNGPSSLEDDEMKDLQMRLTRIVNEMKSFQSNSRSNNGGQGGQEVVEGEILNKNVENASTAVGTSTVTVQQQQQQVSAVTAKKSIAFNDSNIRAQTGSPPPPSPPSPPQTATSPPAQTSSFYEHNDEEGEAYNGRGGLGLAKGTANTYLIDGMEEMSPEEYRKALQESISGRQAQRRNNGHVTVGNLASNNYLDFLNKKE
jgi:uncharacterized coiled-coil protein SlyX